VNLIDYTRRMESATAERDLPTARLIAAEARAAGLDHDADLLLILFGERTGAAFDRLAAEVVR
jgi:hypothetical protein